MLEALLEKGADPCALDNIVGCLPQSGLAINVILGTTSLDIVNIRRASVTHLQWIYVCLDRQKGNKQAYTV
jgi:hypothetical protein